MSYCVWFLDLLSLFFVGRFCVGAEQVPERLHARTWESGEFSKPDLLRWLLHGLLLQLALG